MTEQTNSTDKRLSSILESLLLVSEKPLGLERIEEIMNEYDSTAVREAMNVLKAKYAEESSGIELTEVANGYQFRTKSENSPWIFKLNKARPVRLSRAALETLSIVAYRQPVTRPEIDDIRGVDSGPVLKSLLERNLIKILGKREEPGSPLIYGTTKDFLEFFSLRNLSDLPTLREYTELGEESRAKLEELLPEEPPTATVDAEPTA
jgi:segregation and condensation protein B